MSWFSILPPYLAILETWIIRLFLLLALATIAPWLLLILYDILLYILRSIYHETPFVGGRARGRRKPRRPMIGELGGDIGGGIGAGIGAGAGGLGLARVVSWGSVAEEGEEGDDEGGEGGEVVGKEDDEGVGVRKRRERGEGGGGLGVDEKG